MLNFEKNNFVHMFLALINTILMVLAYRIKMPYYIFYFLALLTLTLEFSSISKAKISQAFLCSSIIVVSISSTQIIFVCIYCKILSITPYELFVNPEIFFSQLSILFILSFIIFKITLKFIFLEDIIKLSKSSIYNMIVSITILIIITYTTIDIEIMNRKDYVIEYMPMIVIIQILNLLLFYTVFFYSIKNVKIVMFKRKSDEIKIYNKKNEEKIRLIEDKVSKDPLTSCYNRKYILDVLKLRKINNIPNFALLFIDIDGLKNVNDTLGHDFGDEYIINVSIVLNESIREDDLIARIGGDEFLIILNDLEKNNINNILFRISKKLDILDKSTDKYKVSASIGHIFVDEHLLKTSVENIIKMADDKMRIKKSHLKENNS